MQNWPAVKIERRKVSALVPYANNARTHSDDQVAMIAASIREWGWTSPILVDEAGMIIAGHARVLAAKSLGANEVPVVVARGWTEAQKRAYVIADNQLALNAGWDESLLRIEITALDGDFDVGLLGFSEDYLAGLLVDRTAGLTDPDDVPPVPDEPVTRPGELWLCGNHRLLCGDATNPGDVARLLGGAKIDAILTDPPYSSGGRQDGGKRHSTSIGTRSAATIARDNLTTKGYLALMSLVLGAIDAETAYVFTDWRMWSWTYDALEAAGYPVRNMLVWDKEQMGMGFPWRSQHELIAFAKRTGAKLNDGKRGNVLKCARQKNELHPTQKPAELITAILSNEPGSKIYDPFAGSGTTMIAAEMEGRQALCLEISPAYCDVAVKRWEAFTGKTAERDYDAQDDARKSYDAAIEAKRLRANAAA